LGGNRICSSLKMFDVQGEEAKKECDFFGQLIMTNDIQLQIIQIIKDNLPTHLSFVEELADLLDISTDSAYRRMRGETPLTIHEVQILSKEYSISVDSLLSSNTNIVPFHYQPIDEAKFTFRNYLENVLELIKMVNQFEDQKIVYLANDIPLFHLMHMPEVASFKLFFWEKTILNYSNLSNEKFELGKPNDYINGISRKLRDLYCAIPSTEIYSSESIDATLKQIEYYWISGNFKSESDAVHLCDRLIDLIEHMRSMAASGYKFKYQRDKELPSELRNNDFESNFKVYFNEVVHTDNTVLIHAGDQYRTYLTNNGINSFFTSSKRFYDDTERGVKILLQKATLISGTAEKERSRIFNKFVKKVNKLKFRIVDN